jgi:hypothetical protein
VNVGIDDRPIIGGNYPQGRRPATVTIDRYGVKVEDFWIALAAE